MSAEAQSRPRSAGSAAQGQGWLPALVAFLLVLSVVTAATLIAAPTRTRTVPLFPPGPYVAEAFRSAEAFVIAGIVLGAVLGLVAFRMVMKVWPNQERRGEFIAGYLFLTPYLIITLFFTVGVLLFALYIAFFKYDIFTAPVFVGGANFLRAFRTRDFLQSLVNVFWYSLIVTPIQTFLALLLAVLLNSRLRGKQFFRTVMYTPSVTSSVVISMIFWWLYLKTGYVNFVLAKVIGAFGGQFQLINWLNDPRGLFQLILGIFGVTIPYNQQWYLAGPSVTWMAIMGLNIFTTIPTFMIMFLAALQDVPGSVYEAAEMDGASARTQFFRITIPMMRPAILLVVVLGTIGTLQIFDQVFILTSGGPLGTTQTPVFQVYSQALGTLGPIAMGFGSAMAFILAIIIFAFTFLQRRFIEGGTEGY
jgi:multiple sugar transport system permease protein